MNLECPDCGKLCDNNSGNPGLWTVLLPDPEKPGKMSCHHTQCVALTYKENVFYKGKLIATQEKLIARNAQIAEILQENFHLRKVMDEAEIVTAWKEVILCIAPEIGACIKAMYHLEEAIKKVKSV